jgi:hypothetical protein
MRLPWLLAASCLAVSPTRAQPQETRAFETAYAASYYQFDACGDALAGREWRLALSQKVRQCPFSDAAKQRFVTRTAAQRRKSGEILAKQIEDKGGLPVQLDGMSRTCREQMDSEQYRAIRARLDDFVAGKAAADTVVPQPCDAAEISP